MPLSLIKLYHTVSVCVCVCVCVLLLLWCIFQCHTCARSTVLFCQTGVHTQDKQHSIWSKLTEVPYWQSSVCVVDGVLLAIGGYDESKVTSAICAFHPVDQKWEHVADMPFECWSVDTLLLSGGRLLVVDGHTQKVLKITVEGKSCYK